VNCCPLTFSLVQLSHPTPLPCVNKYTVYTTVCTGGGVGHRVLGFRQINICRKVSLQVNFLDGGILHCLLGVYDAAYKEKTVLLFVLPIYLLWRRRGKGVYNKDVAFLNIAEDGWLHVEAGPVNSPPTQQQPGTLHVGSIKTGCLLIVKGGWSAHKFRKSQIRTFADLNFFLDLRTF
jgi:hypothetical protein